MAPRRVVGFYTDRRKRVRPITKRGGHRGFKKLFKFVLKKTKKYFDEPLLRSIINSFLRQTPFLRELHSAFVVADAVYTNLDLIKESYNSYQKGGLMGVAKEVRSDALRKDLLVAIKGYVDRNQDSSFSILSMVIERITEEEIKYVRDFLEQAG